MSMSYIHYTDVHKHLDSQGTIANHGIENEATKQLCVGQLT